MTEIVLLATGVPFAHSAEAIFIPCPEAEFDVDTLADYTRLHATESNVR